MNKPARSIHLQGIDRINTRSIFSVLPNWIMQPCMLTAVIALLLTVVPEAVVGQQDDFDSLYDKASLNFRQGKYEEALHFYRKANGLRGNTDLECLWGIAQTFGKLGAHKNAIQACDRLLQVGSNDIGFLAKAWNLRGNTLSAAAMENPGKPSEAKLREAEAAFREVLKFGSSLNMAHYNLGITLIRLRRLEEGLDELRAYVKNAEEEDIAEKAKKIIEDPRRAVEDFAPDFSYITSDGEYVSSDELRGKVLLLDFWGVWCKPCLDAIPYVSQLTKKHRKDAFVLISVDVNDEEAKWREFISQNRMNWTQTRDSNSKIQRAFRISAFPSYVLIDHEGIIRYRGKGSGPQTEGEISDAVKRTLKALAAAPDRRASASAGPQLSNNGNPVPVSLQDLANNAPIPSAAAPDMAQPKAESPKVFVLRIPKPSVEVTVANMSNPPAGMGSMAVPYMLKIRNWASLPDELFASSKDLMPCSVGSRIPLNSPSTRLELIVWSEQGQMLRSFCSPPRPEILQSLFLIIPEQAKQGRIYVTLKDRLTGNSVQSDLVSLP